MGGATPCVWSCFLDAVSIRMMSGLACCILLEGLPSVEAGGSSGEAHLKYVISSVLSFLWLGFLLNALSHLIWSLVLRLLSLLSSMELFFPRHGRRPSWSRRKERISLHCFVTEGSMPSLQLEENLPRMHAGICYIHTVFYTSHIYHRCTYIAKD